MTSFALKEVAKAYENFVAGGDSGDWSAWAGPPTGGPPQSAREVASGIRGQSRAPHGAPGQARQLELGHAQRDDRSLGLELPGRVGDASRVAQPRTGEEQ